MTLASVIAAIRSRHYDCCLTDSYEENNCSLNIGGLDRAALTTLHGTDYQDNHSWQGRLCDRIIFGRLDENFFCAVELKGGRKADVSVAIDQIQGGIDLANSLLSGQWVTEWRPLLLYSGSMPKQESIILQKKKVSYRGRTRTVRRLDCGSRLLDSLNQP